MILEEWALQLSVHGGAPKIIFQGRQGAPRIQFFYLSKVLILYGSLNHYGKSGIIFYLHVYGICLHRNQANKCLDFISIYFSKEKIEEIRDKYIPDVHCSTPYRGEIVRKNEN